mgnify:FL=1
MTSTINMNDYDGDKCVAEDVDKARVKCKPADRDWEKV